MNKGKLEAVCQHAGLDAANAEYLSEGAWHDAWRVGHEDHVYVLRIPKEIAYGRETRYDEAALNAEYGGTSLYYALVNQAVKGAAPSFYRYYVSEELSYTIETYAGEPLDLKLLNEEEAKTVGQAIGEIYRKAEEIPVDLSGLGYIAWSEERGLHGEFDFNFKQFMEEECQEFLADYDSLGSDWEDQAVRQALEEAIRIRKQAFTVLRMTNQDASPENILIEDGKVRLIDPYPILYHGPVMAGNFMNLYEMLFISLSETDRYRKHRFQERKDALQRIAAGFFDGYCDGSRQKAREVRAEQFLQVLQTATAHQQLLKGTIPDHMRIRYGDERMIRERLAVLKSELKRTAGLLSDELPLTRSEEQVQEYGQDYGQNDGDEDAS